MKSFSEFNQNNKIQIYLDMDGVLADFNKGARKAYEHYHKIVGLYSDMKTTKYKEKLRQDLIDNIKDTKDFWLNLDWEPNGQALWSFIKSNIDKSNIAVLTAPLDQDEKRCCRDKFVWITKKLGGIPKQRFICAHDKWNYVGKFNSSYKQILIDDRKDNIDKWNNSGGIGILHNSQNLNDTIKNLEQILSNK
jgi:5'(3')-deoxyribonucleotidase